MLLIQCKCNHRINANSDTDQHENTLYAKKILHANLVTKNKTSVANQNYRWSLIRYRADKIYSYVNIVTQNFFVVFLNFISISFDHIHLNTLYSESRRRRCCCRRFLFMLHFFTYEIWYLPHIITSDTFKIVDILARKCRNTYSLLFPFIFLFFMKSFYAKKR